MSSTTIRIALIKDCLTTALQPVYLNILDVSHSHKGHSGAEEATGGHFDIHIISCLFQEKSLLERHRMIYAALKDLMPKEIHAISINAGSFGKI